MKIGIGIRISSSRRIAGVGRVAYRARVLNVIQTIFSRTIDIAKRDFQ